MTTATELPTCRWCGALPHQGECPRVKFIEFHEDGTTVKHVEFWPVGEVSVSSSYVKIGEVTSGTSSSIKFELPTEIAFYHGGGVAS